MKTVVTLAGLAKFAAAAAEGGSPVVLAHLAVGDGNGQPIEPGQNMSALVNERHRAPVLSSTISLENPNWLIVKAIVPGAAGPWWIRELGLFDESGALLVVAQYPDTYKAVASEGVETSLEVTVTITVTSTSNVQVAPNSENYATQEWVLSRKVSISQLTGLPFIPVKSFTTALPPSSPAIGDLFAIPPGAGGAWANHAQRIAEWSGASWTILIPPDGHLIGTPNGKCYWRAGGIYSEVSLAAFATLAEHLAGVSLAKMTNPAGVKAMLDALKTDLLGYIGGLVIATGNVNADWGQKIYCDTSGGAISVTLPVPADQPVGGKRVAIEIYRFGANAVTVMRNGQPIAGLAEHFSIDRDKVGVRAVWVGTTWRLHPEVVA
ncbi:phage tail protein [Shinella yambaruensis]|uniref:Phage tail fibre protein N-terminal domain-containing protein n=1 Tax=Shinella yambaruensis TaxID=415996 RepID=A0ABQ5ZF45_9HYPH|nr:phage tail protein [Shinella yambaruensis]MCJ8027005.1 phage tail protein [Shinella yambaruensis]MCU7982103.1 phage tail protein [Shinella yambaruensis]GLR51278.1 hypothetical protein GCM10007923_24860 [Shinella yambaruensis]